MEMLSTVPEAEEKREQWHLDRQKRKAEEE